MGHVARAHISPSSWSNLTEMRRTPIPRPHFQNPLPDNETGRLEHAAREGPLGHVAYTLCSYLPRSNRPTLCLSALPFMAGLVKPQTFRPHTVNAPERRSCSHRLCGLSRTLHGPVGPHLEPRIRRMEPRRNFRRVSVDDRSSRPDRFGLDQTKAVMGGSVPLRYR